MLQNDVRWTLMNGFGIHKEYYISDGGQVKTVRKKNGREWILKTDPNKFGYIRASLFSVQKHKQISKPVHVLVAKNYCYNQNNKPEVNHKDGNKSNNHYSNLEWVTKKENAQHAIANNLNSPTYGTINGMCKLTEQQVLEIFNSKLTGVLLSKMYGVCPGAISTIRSGRSWSFLTGKEHKSSFLSEKEVLEIYKSNLLNRELAVKYNVSMTTISGIKTGKNWSYLTKKKYVQEMFW